MRSSNEHNRWEIGSEFHWQEFPTKGPFVKWPEPHVMFISGRVALPSTFRILQDSSSKILFIPDYFCQEVAEWWSRQGILIKRYIDGPHLVEPVWKTIIPSKGDAVLAVNYFGVRDGNIWNNWHENNCRVLLIEDHTHDPVSEWALRSKADFAFASLRKTFPVPDGAILWSPKGLQLPDEPVRNDWLGSAYKLAAMMLKKEYLNGADENLKDVFRGFQLKGELIFDYDKSDTASPWSKFFLSFGYPIEWRQIREKNIREFINLMDGNSTAQTLFVKWPANHCPFNAVLLFPSKLIRDKYRSRLIDSNIYTSIHWVLKDTCSADSVSLANRIMTIPVDQRYGVKDIRRIVETILNTK